MIRDPFLPRAGRSSRQEWLRNALLVETAASALCAGSDTPGSNFAVGAKSPPLEVRTVDGKTTRIHRQTGKVVLVDFMTTTCPSCKQASAGIQLLYQEMGRRGFLPVAVALDVQAPSMLSAYRSVHGLTFPAGIAPLPEVLRYLSHPVNKPIFVPTLVLLDKLGRITIKRVVWTGEQESAPRSGDFCERTRDGRVAGKTGSLANEIAFDGAVAAMAEDEVGIRESGWPRRSHPARPHPPSRRLRPQASAERSQSNRISLSEVTGVNHG
jgi:thiol-disulfide isomerase/thioredoxin